MSETEVQPAPIEIEGQDGLVLRQLRLEDAQAYFDLIDTDREHFKYGQETTPQKYQMVEQVRDSIEKGDSDRLRFGVWDGDTMVGSINLTTIRPSVGEVGYWIGGKHKGHGYAQRAVKAILPFAFEQQGMTKLVAWVNGKNLASIKSLERNGFKHSMGTTELLYELER